MKRRDDDDLISRETLVTWLRDNGPHLSAGLFAADAMNYGKAVADLETASTALLHFDVMDGVFCPQMTAGSGLVKAIKTSMLKDVHLMVADPLLHIPQMLTAGSDIVHVHAETMPHLHRALVALDCAVPGSERKVIRAVALNPGSPVELLKPVLHQIEMATFLAVDPGWSGGAPDAALAAKIADFRAMAAERGCDPLICIDGGITPATYADAVAMAPDIIVSGSAIFKKGRTIDENLNLLRGYTKGHYCPGKSGLSAKRPAV